MKEQKDNGGERAWQAFSGRLDLAADVKIRLRATGECPSMTLVAQSGDTFGIFYSDDPAAEPWPGEEAAMIRFCDESTLPAAPTEHSFRIEGVIDFPEREGFTTLSEGSVKLVHQTLSHDLLAVEDDLWPLGSATPWNQDILIEGHLQVKSDASLQLQFHFTDKAARISYGSFETQLRAQPLDVLKEDSIVQWLTILAATLGFCLSILQLRQALPRPQEEPPCVESPES